MGRTLAELGEAMPAEEFQGHIEDLGYIAEQEPEEEGVQMTPTIMAGLLGLDDGR